MNNRLNSELTMYDIAKLIKPKYTVLKKGLTLKKVLGKKEYKDLMRDLKSFEISDLSLDSILDFLYGIRVILKQSNDPIAVQEVQKCNYRINRIENFVDREKSY